MYPAGTQLLKAKFGKKLTDEQRREATTKLAGAQWSGPNDSELTFSVMVTTEMQEGIQQIIALGGQHIEIIPQQSAQMGQSSSSTGFSQQPHRGADTMEGGQGRRQHPTH